MMVSKPSRSEARPSRPAASGRGRAGWRTRPLAGLLAGGFALIAVAGGGSRDACALEGSKNTAASPAASVSAELSRREKTYIKRTWGIEILFVRRTSAGYMLEFRYKVVDADRAKPLFERRTKPVLTDAETGIRLAVPTPAKTGALRNSNTPITGRTYWMVFANPGGLVKQGNLVSIEIGDFRVDDLVVQ